MQDTTTWTTNHTKIGKCSVCKSARAEVGTLKSEINIINADLARKTSQRDAARKEISTLRMELADAEQGEATLLKKLEEVQ